MSAAASRSRIERLQAHLAPGRSRAGHGFPGHGGIQASETAGRGWSDLDPFDERAMAAYLGGEHQGLRASIYEHFLARPELMPPVSGLTKEAHRELVRQMIYSLLGAGVRPMQLFQESPRKYFAVAEAGCMVDLSLVIKMGVQYSLWGGSVLNLGGEEHRAKYAEGIGRMDIPGCFAMTELRHGSNVAQLKTTATYDPAAQEFVVNTPDEGAIKWWIGNGAEDGVMATVFARLIMPDQGAPGGEADMGVHAFVVPLRDPASKRPLPGVEIRDCGYKIGLQGVDNGAFRFHGVRIPREGLLNRFGGVTPDGRYESPLPNAARRFAATIGELTGGRVGLACGSVGVLKGAVTIAVRYSAVRQQFGPAGGEEISILDYQSQQGRLMPLLASAYGFHFAKEHLVDLYTRMKIGGDQSLVGEVHSLSAGLKAHVTAFTAAALNTCRESAGGHGYAAVNRFGDLRNDHDIFQTFEGDNTVLKQQVAADLLKHYADRFRGGGIGAGYAYLKGFLADTLPSNPLVTHQADEVHLRDSRFHLSMMRHRSARLLHTVALRLRKHTQRSGAFEGWNKCLAHLLALADAHIECVILEQFVSAVRHCPDAESRGALKVLCDLYALTAIQGDIGAWRNEDAIAPNKAKAISKLIVKLCAQARGIALPLVASFDIPDGILRAPIGMRSEADLYGEYLAAAGFGPEGAEEGAAAAAEAAAEAEAARQGPGRVIAV